MTQSKKHQGEFVSSLKKIKQDKFSGSQRVLDDTIAAYHYFLKLDTGINDIKLARYIKFTLRGLLESHNQFALLRHFRDDMLGESEKYFNKDTKHKSLREHLLKTAESYYKTWRGVNDRICSNALLNINFSDKTVFLHSNSSTVRQLFDHIKKQRLNTEIIQTESRPKCEGKHQAEYLANQGFKVTYIVDPAAVKYLSRADFVVMGCDCIYENNFINKIGTKAIAVGCKAVGIPFYVITDSRKFSKSEYLKPENRKPVSEIFSGASSMPFIIENYYFESTPTDYVTKLITESFVLDGEQIKDYFISGKETVEDLIRSRVKREV
jgi:translation initiation factor 2B subunit (eIF-2B alpha/beta/delta family)